MEMGTIENKESSRKAVQPPRIAFPYSLTVLMCESVKHSALWNASRQGSDKKIYANAVYGVTLSGINSYIKLENPLKQGQLKFKLGFRTRQTSANLFTIYKNSGSFVVLDLLEGKIRVLLASLTSNNQSFITVSQNQINVCDYQRHDILVTIGQLGVGIQLDSNINQVFPYPNGLSPPDLINSPVYVGGLGDTPFMFPDAVSKVSLTGCVESVMLQDIEHDLAQTVKSSKGLTFVCPI